MLHFNQNDGLKENASHKSAYFEGHHLAVKKYFIIDCTIWTDFWEKVEAWKKWGIYINKSHYKSGFWQDFGISQNVKKIDENHHLQWNN